MSYPVEGSIVRVMHASDGGKNHARNLLDFGEVGWAFVKKVNEGGGADPTYEVKWVIPDRFELQDLCPWLNDNDHYDVVELDDVPDDVITAVAKLKLIGDA